MFDKSQKIQIQGKYYAVDELMVLCKEKISSSEVQQWEKDIYLFLQDWFSLSKSISVTTSGSTGSPKKISLQKRHMIASAKATIAFFNLKRDDSAWLCLPVKYIAGKMMIVRAIVGKMNLLYSEPSSVPGLPLGQKVSFVAMVPNQVFGLLNSQGGIQQMSYIKNLLIGGSGISDELERNLLLIPDINAWHTYGMTETITHIALRRISQDNKPGRFHPLPGIQIRTNPDDQLTINAPALGVTDLVTNDIARIHGDGSFVLIGRADNVVISGGVKLFPEVIEGKISNCISNCYFVGGVPDHKLGEKLILFIESNPDDKNSIDLLKKEIKQELQKFEMPKEIIHLMKFIRTKTGKIVRKQIINNYLSGSS